MYMFYGCVSMVTETLVNKLKQPFGAVVVTDIVTVLQQIWWGFFFICSEYCWYLSYNKVCYLFYIFLLSDIWSINQKLALASSYLRQIVFKTKSLCLCIIIYQQINRWFTTAEHPIGYCKHNPTLIHFCNDITLNL